MAPESSPSLVLSFPHLTRILAAAIELIRSCMDRCAAVADVFTSADAFVSPIPRPLPLFVHSISDAKVLFFLSRILIFYLYQITESRR